MRREGLKKGLKEANSKISTDGVYVAYNHLRIVVEHYTEDKRHRS